VEDLGARRLAELIPRPLSRRAQAGKFDQPMRPVRAAAASRCDPAARKPFHQLHTTLVL
jgi:hypothetical protein